MYPQAHFFCSFIHSHANSKRDLCNIYIIQLTCYLYYTQNLYYTLVTYTILKMIYMQTFCFARDASWEGKGQNLRQSPFTLNQWLLKVEQTGKNNLGWHGWAAPPQPQKLCYPKSCPCPSPPPVVLPRVAFPSVRMPSKMMSHPHKEAA